MERRFTPSSLLICGPSDQYWIDYAPELGYKMGGMEMPVNYVVEMFCDRVAACQIYQKEKYGASHRPPF